MAIFRDGLLSLLVDKYQLSSSSNEFYLLALGFAILAIAFSYILGSLSSAIIVSKAMFKEDIRDHGSGNAVLTNILRT